MNSQAAPTIQVALAGSSSDEKFALIAKAIRWVFEVTRNPGLAGLEVTVGPTGVVVSGDGGPMDKWWAKLLAEQHSRGLPVTCNVQPVQNCKGDPKAA